jgi:hypothetical protein
MSESGNKFVAEPYVLVFRLDADHIGQNPTYPTLSETLKQAQPEEILVYPSTHICHACEFN